MNCSPARVAPESRKPWPVAGLFFSKVVTSQGGDMMGTAIGDLLRWHRKEYLPKRYYELARQLVPTDPDTVDPLWESRLVAIVCERTGIQPSEFRALPEAERVVLLEKASQGGKPRKAARAVSLTPEDEAILRALKKDHPTLMTQENLSELVRKSVRTISVRLQYLRGKTLVHNPQGNRKGVGITDVGLELLDRI
jgi:hypothetical protein